MDLALEETDGGAIVYKAIEGTEHFACPSCIAKKRNTPVTR